MRFDCSCCVCYGDNCNGFNPVSESDWNCPFDFPCNCDYCGYADDCNCEDCLHFDGVCWKHRGNRTDN